MKARNSPWAYTVHTVRPDLAASLFSLGEFLNETFGDWDDPNPALKAIIEVIGGEKARKLWWAGHRVLSAQQRVQFAVYRRDVDELQSNVLGAHGHADGHTSRGRTGEAGGEHP